MELFPNQSQRTCPKLNLYGGASTSEERLLAFEIHDWRKTEQSSAPYAEAYSLRSASLDLGPYEDASVRTHWSDSFGTLNIYNSQ